MLLGWHRHKQQQKQQKITQLNWKLQNIASDRTKGKKNEINNKEREKHEKMAYELKKKKKQEEKFMHSIHYI